MTNIKGYKDQDILNRVANLPSFVDFPKGYWQVWVRSDEDAFNKFDDKVYLFKGTKFIMAAPCTTNAGADGMMNFDKQGLKGVGVLQSDLIVYDSHYEGLHKGKIRAWRQGRIWPYFRDSNKNNKIEEIGKLYEDKIIYANIHPSSYNESSTVTKTDIGGWSWACLVYAAMKDYNKMMDLTEGQKWMTNCILKEW